jgi:tetratricopeptide (TPR) repeat protein
VRHFAGPLCALMASAALADSSDGAVARGRKALADGNLPAALAAFKEAGPDGASEYAEALAMTGVYEPALAVVEAAHAKAPTDPAPYAAAGWILHYAGATDVARDLWAVAAGDEDESQRRARSALEGINSIGIAASSAPERELRDQLGPSNAGGVVVTALAPGPPSVRGTLQKGDVILGVDADRVMAPSDLDAAVKRAKPGQHLALMVWRKGVVTPLQVQVASTRPSLDEVSPGGEVPKPTRALADELDWADFLLLENHPFQAALAYRRLIDRYPGWYLPYLNYSMALEEVGALHAATSALEHASALPQAELDADARAKVKERLDAVKDRAATLPADWREHQRLTGAIDAETAVLPGGNYLGFGGAQATVGNTPATFGVNARLGRLFSNGLDVAAFVTWTVPGDFSVGATLFDRIYIPPTTKRLSFNAGITGAVSINSPAALGPMLGASFFTGDKRDRSIDVSASVSVLSNPAVVSLNFGMTQFLGR